MLRGEASDGNAAAAAQQALKHFGGLGPATRDQLAQTLYREQDPTPELAILVSEHAALIDELRAATKAGWSMNTLAVERGSELPVPPYPRFIDAALLMLAKASLASPDECLQISADVMRLGQDLVPGAPLESASVAMRVTSIAAHVVARCSTLADVEALARSARELTSLATHAPAAGGGIELADIVTRVDLRRLSRLVAEDGAESPLTRLRKRPALFSAFERLDKPTRWRTLTAARYPEARESWLQELAFRTRSDLPLVAAESNEIDGWLFDDMRGQALLRALAVGAETLAERARRARMPREPIALAEPALRDPFNGRPLKWRIPADGSELALWSVGEDMRDDKASADWSAEAPLDVVVRFRFAIVDAGAQRRPPRLALKSQ